MRLQATGLEAGYGAVPALHGVSVSVEQGEIVAIVGRNGVGKTTLIKALMGLLPATSGSVRLGGNDVTRWPPSRRVRAGLRAVYQERAVFSELTVRDNLRLNGLDASAQADVLEMFPDSLIGRDQQRAGTLSGGEQKMLASGCALRAGASILVMDEPTEGLQPSNVDLLGKHLSQARDDGLGVILVEQHLALATSLATRFVVLEKGEVVASGHADEPDIHERIATHLVI